MKNLALVLAATVAAVTLTGCSGETPDDLSGTSIDTLSYRGETIECVKQGSGNNNTRSCDFTTFYALHGALLTDKTVGKEEGVEWVEFKGEPLACIKQGSGNNNTRSCDFARFYTANPDLIATFVPAEDTHDHDH